MWLRLGARGRLGVGFLVMGAGLGGQHRGGSISPPDFSFLPPSTAHRRRRGPLRSCCGRPALILLHGPGCVLGTIQWDAGREASPASLAAGTSPTRCVQVHQPRGAGDCLPPSRGSLSSHTEGPRMGSGDFPSFLSATILGPSPAPLPHHRATGTVVAGTGEAVDWMGIPQETSSP